MSAASNSRSERAPASERRLRVAWDATALLDPPTGVGRFVAETLPRLAVAPDLDLIAYATSWRGRDRLDEVLPDGVRASSRPMAARPIRMAWMRSDHPTIERWVGSVDVVHGPNFVVPPTRGAAIVTVHDLTSLHHPELCTADTRQYPTLIRRALIRGAHIHAVSQFVADEVEANFTIDASRITVVPNGFTAVAPGGASGVHRLVGTRPYVLALGTVEPRKDLPLLVRAFDRVADAEPDLSLVIAGPDGWGTAPLDEALAGARHRDRIIRLPRFVTEAERSMLLAGALVFCFPSVYEGFGLPPLEAMAGRTAVVATRAGAVPEVVGDAALLTDVGDVEGLEDALDRVIHDEALRSHLVERGTERITHFGWDATAAGLSALYHRLAS